ncbi:MAG TPA: mannose-1-phosphate guanylyltransferase [Myxococcales bacterium]|jgi:mannose-1-phosphate guanylyltransferase
MSLHAIILAGGSGTRFWPLSRAKKPKQFLALVTGKALIAETFLRVEPLVTAARTWVVCGQAHEQGVRELLPSLPAQHVLVEPAARNTAPAIGLACVRAVAEDPDAVLAVLPSDHHIQAPEAFRTALRKAADAAASGGLVTIGIKPTRPETGYGYLKRGAALADGVFRVEAFVEKPDAQTAQNYLQDAAYSWNAGIFVFKAAAMLDAIRRHLPALDAVLQKISAGDAQAFLQAPSISIDYGVMEKEERIALVPGDFGWSDVGSFAALPEVRKLDERGNAVSGDAIVVDSDGCVVLSEGQRLVAAVGVRDLCIIDSGDALLVVPRDQAQDVRTVVDELKKTGRSQLL